VKKLPVDTQWIWSHVEGTACLDVVKQRKKLYIAESQLQKNTQQRYSGAIVPYSGRKEI
jgi:hypothetical protein